MSIAEKLQTIAENEQKVYEAGYNKGKAEGGDTEGAYNEGFEAGKKAESDAFWETYQEGGNRTNYTYAFYAWKDELFNPTYDITFSRAYATFSYSTIKEINKILDFSKMPTVYLTDAQVFRFCYDLETINEIVVCEQNQYTQWFQGCTSLKNITFNGTIGQNISFADSPLLSADSIANIVEHLATVSAKTTITINSAIDMSAYKSTIEGKGWTLVQ